MSGENASSDGGFEMRMSRFLPAAPDVVFDAYTDADKQKIWFSILDEKPGIVEIEVDLRVGGLQTAVWGPDESALFRETQTFLVIEPPHRLVTESTGSTPEGMTMTTRIEVTFKAHDDGTMLDVVQSGFPNVEMRDFFSRYVWVGATERIEAFLSREKESSR